ncbi:hypothetical protein SAMN05518849_12245 [Sphingobium sp. AP50]|uniref:Benenodin family lasso peptide n=1 Tax=Sphingobium rhizovicinum TaxID=432308 RepID=A0ABV7NKF8_9SPHN|nr:hypothetical protein [Sphingobium sp. AP50]SEJ97492.1 hypothetical protein SAMN05518849_12245 [Sphingobium sp. AP50]
MKDNQSVEPFADAGVAAVEDGHVVLDGPDGIAITLTPQAAVATGRSLVEAGEAALEQTKGADEANS